MNTFYAIELSDPEHHDIIEPFLEIVTTFVEHYSTFYIFSSIEDVRYLEQELKDYSIVEMIHTLVYLSEPKLWPSLEDYGFQTDLGNVYLLTSMVHSFEIIGGTDENQQMALLQFDEHLIAEDKRTYYVDVHHQELIGKIANAYKITITFLNSTNI